MNVDKLGECLFQCVEFGDMLHFAAGHKTAASMEHQIRHKMSTKLADYMYSKKVQVIDELDMRKYRMEFYVLDPGQLFELIRDEAYRLMSMHDPETMGRFLAEARVKQEAKT